MTRGPAAPGGAQGLLLGAHGDARKAQALFDALPPVDPGTLHGCWHGEELPTGHPLDGLLAALGWAGKRFGEAGDVDPLVFARGGRRFAVHPWLPARAVRLVLRWPRATKARAVVAVARAALPALRTRRPRARLVAVAAGDARTAAIAYDDAPIVDALKALGEGVVLGRMQMAGMDRPYFFVLRRAAARGA